MTRRLSGLLSLFLLSPWATAATCRNDSGSKQTIQVAAESSYRNIRDGQLWRNPEVFVEGTGIYIKLPENRLERRSLSIEEALLLLNQQSCSVWPYGAVVMLSFASIGSPSDDHTAMSKVFLDLQKALEKDGFKASLWPSG